MKIPELKAARDEKKVERDSMKNGHDFLEKCCNEPPCVENFTTLRICTQEDWDEADKEVNGLEYAINDWTDTVNIEVDVADIDEFFGSKNPFIHNQSNEGGRLSIDNHPSGLVPPFYKKATCGIDNVNGVCAKECHLCENGECKDKKTESGECPASVIERHAFLKTNTSTNRMQFSGGGGVFEMTMNHEYSSSKSGLGCWHGCGVDWVSKQCKFLFLNILLLIDFLSRMQISI